MSLLERTLRASLIELGADPDKPWEPSGMTVTQVRQQLVRVATAAASCDLDGVARGERMLWLRVLQSIADGSASDPRKLAVEALKTTEVVYDREVAK